MATRDIVSKISEAISLTIATRTASANGGGVDLRGYESAAVLVVTGTITDGTHTIEVQESDDNSTFTAVDDGNLQGSEPAIGGADNDKLYEIGYLGSKRYIRVITSVSGATSGGTYGAVVVRSHARSKPV